MNCIRPSDQESKLTVLFRHCAEQNDYSSLVEWCKSSDVNESVAGYRALEMAVAIDDENATRVLLSNGANASLFPTGTTALHLACLMNSLSIVSMLVDARADVNARDEDRVSFLGQTVSVSICGGRTPLAIAAEQGRVDIVRHLLQHGASVDIGDNNGSLPIELVESALVLTTSEVKKADLNTVRQLLLSKNSTTTTIRELPTIEVVKARQQECEQKLRLRSRIARTAEQARRLDDGLAVVATKYKPLHPEIYSAVVDRGVDVARDANEIIAGYGLFSLPLFDAQFCQRLIEEIVNYEREAKLLGLPLFYRHDDNIGSLERCGFMPLLDRLASTISPLLDRLTHNNNNNSDVVSASRHMLRARHAFVTRNHVGRVEMATFKKHRDKSDITLNVCIERTDDVEGSTVTFFKYKRTIELLIYINS